MTDDKTPRTPGGELEFTLLATLWSKADRTASARELYDRVGAPRGIVYTTVAKVLDRLFEKGMVTRRRDGRAYIYTPTARRVDTERAMVRALIERILGDDPQPAVAALIGAVEDVSPDLLDQLRAELETRKRES